MESGFLLHPVAKTAIIIDRAIVVEKKRNVQFMVFYMIL